MTLSPPALERLVALARAASEVDWHDEPRAARLRWGRIERVVASLPAGDAADRELAAAWDLCLLDEVLQVPDVNGFEALDLLSLSPSELTITLRDR